MWLATTAIWTHLHKKIWNIFIWGGFIDALTPDVELMVVKTSNPHFASRPACTPSFVSGSQYHGVVVILAIIVVVHCMLVVTSTMLSSSWWSTLL